MKREFLIILIVLSTISIYGCGGSSSAGGNGLEMSILNAPSSSITAGNPFYLTVELRNKGKSAISGGKLEIGNFDPGLITSILVTGSTDSNQAGTSAFSLEGRSRYSTEGGYITKSFTLKTNTAQAIETYSTDLRITACFDYITNAGGQICINNDPANPIPKDAECSVGVGTVLADQGAPVALSSLKSYSNPEDTTISFTISYNNQGTIFKPGLADCTKSIGYENLNYVKISAITLGVTPIPDISKCTNLDKDGLLRLNEDGTATFECNFANTKDSGIQQRAISFTMTYGQKINIKQPITIVKQTTRK